MEDTEVSIRVLFDRSGVEVTGSVETLIAGKEMEKGKGREIEDAEKWKAGETGRKVQENVDDWFQREYEHFRPELTRAVRKQVTDVMMRIHRKGEGDGSTDRRDWLIRFKTFDHGGQERDEKSGIKRLGERVTWMAEIGMNRS